MKKSIIVEVIVTLIVVLFMRLTILDNGFLLGFKNRVGFDIPILIMQYESKEGSLLRKVESNFGLLQVASGYSFIILGKFNDKWFFLDRVQS